MSEITVRALTEDERGAVPQRAAVRAGGVPQAFVATLEEEQAYDEEFGGCA